MPLLAQPDTGSIVHSGKATYYNATGSGNCMFDPTPGDLMVAAMNNTEYANASVCGASVRVTGPKGQVTVRIVDKCPGCAVGGLDLSKQAFMRIADTSQGIVNVTWRYVETAVTGPIAYRIKTGSSAYWIAIQILNHRNPVVKLEARKNNAWSIVPRKDYNYFVDSTGLGSGPFTFRITDSYGQQLIDSLIPLNAGAVIQGGANFPSHAAGVREGHSLNESKSHRGRIFPLLRLPGIGALPPGAIGSYQAYSIRGDFLSNVSLGEGGNDPRRLRMAKTGVLVLRSVNR
jgi:expansin